MLRRTFNRRHRNEDRNEPSNQSTFTLPHDSDPRAATTTSSSSSSTRETLSRYLQIMSDESERLRLEESVSRRRNNRSSRSSNMASNSSLDEELLQLSVDGLQDSLALFESVVRANQEKGAPPASDSAISKLPHARVLPSDKVDNECSNELCTVCTERLVDGVAVSRLPCGHVYHINCIVPWLNRTCTCPDCRYELPTNDAAFEAGRVRRMADRPVYECKCHPSGMHNCFFVPPEQAGLVIKMPSAEPVKTTVPQQEIVKVKSVLDVPQMEESSSSVWSDDLTCMPAFPEDLEDDYLLCLNRF